MKTQSTDLEEHASEPYHRFRSDIREGRRQVTVSAREVSDLEHRLGLQMVSQRRTRQKQRSSVDSPTGSGNGVEQEEGCEGGDV